MPTTENELKYLFSTRLSKIMQDKDINQVELSKVIGVSESTVGKWLLKKAMPRMGVIQKLAEYFGVKKSYFLEFKPQKESVYYLDPETARLAQAAATDPDMRLLLDAKRDLSPEDMRLIIDLAKRLLNRA